MSDRVASDSPNEPERHSNPGELQIAMEQAKLCVQDEEKQQRSMTHVDAFSRRTDFCAGAALAFYIIPWSAAASARIDGSTPPQRQL